MKDPLLFEQLIKTYEDLIFDICKTILKKSINVNTVFRSILKKIRKTYYKSNYIQYERSWILRIIYKQLLDFYKCYGKRILELNERKQENNDSFEFFFSLLSLEDQLLLLLKNKFKIPFSEISSAFLISEDSIKVKYQLALHTIEERMWSKKD